jgi:hypothetical protein
LVVVCPLDDLESQSIARLFDAQVVWHPAGGFLAALVAGFQACAGESVAFLDDDAVPAADWLRQMDRWLRSDDAIGGIGGRILNIVDGRTTARRYEHGPVAEVSFFGRLRTRLHDIPSHRIVAEVDFLPGSCMCFRPEVLEAVSVDLDCGMAPGNELEFGLACRSLGYAVLFDSDIVVYHYPAPRVDSLARDDVAGWAKELAFTTSAILSHRLPLHRVILYAMYSLLVGDRSCPGVLLWPPLLFVRKSEAVLSGAGCMREKAKGIRWGLRARRGSCRGSSVRGLRVSQEGRAADGDRAGRGIS